MQSQLKKRALPYWFRPVMALLLVILSFASFAGLWWFSPVDDRSNLTMAIFGFVSGSALSPVIMFVFGSSSGSADKQAAQERQIELATKRDVEP